MCGSQGELLVVAGVKSSVCIVLIRGEVHGIRILVAGITWSRGIRGSGSGGLCDGPRVLGMWDVDTLH